MPRRILVMGTTGTVGREVVNALAAWPRGEFEVFAAARREPDALPEGVQHVPFQLGDPASIVDALEDVDALFSMTPLIEEQVILSRRVLDIALARGVRQVVRLSSRSAGWDFESELRAWHREIDADIAARAPLSTFLRPCSFMQNFLTHQAKNIRERGLIGQPLGDAVLPYIDARDIADVAVRAFLDPAAHNAKTYVLTGGEAIGVADVARAFGEARGAPVRYVAVEPDKTEAGMRASDMPAWLIDSALRVQARTRAGLEAATTTHVTEVLGRAPRTIDDYARDHAQLLS